MVVIEDSEGMERKQQVTELGETDIFGMRIPSGCFQAEEKGKWGGLGEGWGRCQQTQGGLGPRACAEVSKANWSVPKAINS